MQTGKRQELLSQGDRMPNPDHSSIQRSVLHRVSDMQPFAAWQFVASAIHAEFDPLNSGILRIKEGSWGEASGEINAIYIRACYNELYQIIRGTFGSQSIGSVAIVGSPGVGKSVFGVFLIFKLTVEGKIVLYEGLERKMLILGEATSEDDLNFIRAMLKKMGYEPIDRGAYRVLNKIMWKWLCDQPNFVLVQDLEDLHFQVASKVTCLYECSRIILTCPTNREFGIIQTDLHGILRLHMPLWTLDELLIARRELFPVFPEQEIKDRLEDYGGIPLFAFQLSREWMDQRLDQCFSYIDFEVLVRALRSLSRKNAPAPRPTEDFIHVSPVRYEGDIDLSLGDAVLDELSRKYRNFQCVFGSAYFEQQLMQLFDEFIEFRTGCLVNALQRIPECRVLSRALRENFIHKKIVKGGKWDLVMLKNGMGNLNSLQLPRLLARKPFVGRKGLKDVKKVRTNEYICPRSRNYITWDAAVVLQNSVFRPNGLVLLFIQCTDARKRKPLDGAVIEEDRKTIANNLHPSLSVEDLQVILIFATSTEGVKQVQSVHANTTSAYPKYAMIVNGTFETLKEMLSVSQGN